MTTAPLHRRLTEVAPRHERDNDLVLRGLLEVDDTEADLSITWVQLAGHHRRLRTDASTRVYVIVSGAGSITVDADVREVGAGDVVVIPRRTPYHLDGTLTYLVLNQPGFREGDDHYLEEHSVPETSD